MFEKLLKQWAKEQGFDVWSQDHAAVLNNLAKWLDKNSTQKSAQKDCPVCHKRDKIIPYPPYGKICTRCGTRMKLST